MPLAYLPAPTYAGLCPSPLPIVTPFSRLAISQQVDRRFSQGNFDIKVSSDPELKMKRNIASFNCKIPFHVPVSQ